VAHWEAVRGGIRGLGAMALLATACLSSPPGSQPDAGGTGDGGPVDAAPTERNFPPSGLMIADLQTAELDGDGNRDLVVLDANADAPGLVVVLGRALDAGDFVRLPLGSEVTAIAVADVVAADWQSNSDGLDDIVAVVGADYYVAPGGSRGPSGFVPIDLELLTPPLLLATTTMPGSDGVSIATAGPGGVSLYEPIDPVTATAGVLSLADPPDPSVGDPLLLSAEQPSDPRLVLVGSDGAATFQATGNSLAQLQSGPAALTYAGATRLGLAACGDALAWSDTFLVRVRFDCSMPYALYQDKVDLGVSIVAVAAGRLGTSGTDVAVLLTELTGSELRLYPQVDSGFPLTLPTSVDRPTGLELGSPRVVFGQRGGEGELYIVAEDSPIQCYRLCANQTLASCDPGC
jgi:hypothetical protein